MESFDLQDVDGYSSDYGRLGRALGVSNAMPAPGELEFLKWVTSGRFGFGMLLPSEIFFAAAITSILRPRRAVEVGTASGFSAAIIAKMIGLRLTEEQIELSGPILHTIDKKAHYVADAGKRLVLRLSSSRRRLATGSRFIRCEIRPTAASCLTERK